MGAETPNEDRMSLEEAQEDALKLQETVGDLANAQGRHRENTEPWDFEEADEYPRIAEDKIRRAKKRGEGYTKEQDWNAKRIATLEDENRALQARVDKLEGKQAS